MTRGWVFSRPMKSPLLRTICLGLALGAGLAGGAAHAQSTVFVTRHEDRGGEEPDPSLTAKGRCQADALAGLLADAKVTQIYTTNLLRTQQTAAPLARLTGVKPVVVDQADFDSLIAKIRGTLRPGESTLVVGHRASVPRIVKALTGQDIAPLGSGEYTRLIAITLFPDGHASVVTLRQGGKCEP
jgi:phosphohistidine phosphatase SixA